MYQEESGRGACVCVWGGGGGGDEGGGSSWGGGGGQITDKRKRKMFRIRQRNMNEYLDTQCLLIFSNKIRTDAPYPNWSSNLILVIGFDNVQLSLERFGWLFNQSPATTRTDETKRPMKQRGSTAYP